MLDIKIGKYHYRQRSEFSKITKTNIYTGKKQSFNALEELDLEEYLLINDALKIQKEPEKYFTYDTTSQNEAILISFDSNGLKNIVIPEYINGHKITAVGEIFLNEKIEKLYLPNTATQIEEYMCCSCLNLKEVYLPNSITILEAFAFKDCINLEKINLENITRIGTECFSECNSLKNITLSNLKTISPFAFFHCKSLIKIDAPELIYISYSAFDNCEKLESIKFNKRLNNIGNSAFKNCTNLKYIILPEQLKIIERNTFENCKNLTTINFPKNLEYIKSKAFANSGLSGIIKLPENLIEIQNMAFQNCVFDKINISGKISYTETAFDAKQTLVLNIYEKYKPKQNDIER